MAKYLIINADDFGLTRGINRGIHVAHTQGIVLSTSLLVDAPWAAEAAAIARKQRDLGVGLHFAVTNEHGALFDLNDTPRVEREWHRQYRRFCDLLGEPPTHIDSHHHVHLWDNMKHLFLTWADYYHLPVRSLGQVCYEGRFHGQWYDEQWQSHPAPEWISVQHLEQILRGLPEGVTELACHPGYWSAELDSPYAVERATELSTLLDPRVPKLIRALDITLINFGTLPQGAVVP